MVPPPGIATSKTSHAPAIRTTTSGRNCATSPAHCCWYRPLPPHRFACTLPSIMKFGNVLISQPRMERSHTARPGWAVSPFTPGFAWIPCAIVAACESPTTSTFKGVNIVVVGAAGVLVPLGLELGVEVVGVVFGKVGGGPVNATSPVWPVNAGCASSVAANTLTERAITIAAIAALARRGERSVTPRRIGSATNVCVSHARPTTAPRRTASSEYPSRPVRPDVRTRYVGQCHRYIS